MKMIFLQLTFFSIYYGFAQDRVISGEVKDESGSPLMGVTVLEKGTNNGVQTDLYGAFSLNVSQGSILQFSFTGFKTREMTVESILSYPKVVLRVESNILDEVVVVGYGEESKALQTSSVVSVKAEEVNNIPTSQLSTSLAGRLPGVNIVQNTGFVGGSASVSVRGASNQALYIIDNVISDKAQFDALDPSEVESINVLKDAAATSIYGARASGGVLLIKTKSGALGKVKVNYRGVVTGYGLMNPLQDWTPEQELIYLNSMAYNKNRAAENPVKNFKPPYDKEALDFARDSIHYQSINDIIWRSPFSQQHSLNVSGGTERIRYFFALNYNNNRGSYDKTSFNKYTLRAKVDANITKNLTIGTNISYNRRITERFYWPYDWDGGEGFTVADFYRPTFNLTRLYPYYSLPNGKPVDYGTPEAIPVIKNWHFHPPETIFSKNYRHIHYNTFNAIFNAKLKIPQVEGLSLKVLGNYRQDTFFKKDFIGEFNRPYIVQTKGKKGVDNLKLAPLKLDDTNRRLEKYNRQFTGIDNNNRLTERYQINGFINYKRTFNETHFISSFIGVEQYQLSSRRMSGTASDVLTKNNDQILATNTSSKKRYFDGSELYRGRLSYFGNFKYSYKGKYIGVFSFRNDGSYIFSEKNRFGFFPSVSVAWVASEESFLEPIKNFANYFKLRFSYGTTGDDSTRPYQFRSRYVPSGSYTFENSTIRGISPQGKLPNPDVKWATNITIDLGVDMKILNKHLGLSFDYFDTQHTGILVSSARGVPGTLGASFPATNQGELKSYGIDISMNYRNKIGEDFVYSMGFNLGYAMEKFVKWPQAENIPDIQKVIGLPTSGVVRGYISKGIIRDQAVIDELNAKNYLQHEQKLQLGNVLIKDINGDDYKPGPDGRVDSNDIAILSKNATPRLNFGIPLDFSWKALSLNIFFQGVGPYDKFVSTKNGLGVFQDRDRPYFNIWTQAYSKEYNLDGKYPSIFGSWDNPTRTGRRTSFWKRNGAYISSLMISCNSVLDIDDLSALSPKETWKDPALSNSYLANLYAGVMPGGWPNKSGYLYAGLPADGRVGVIKSSTISISSHPWSESFEGVYRNIRKINILLEEIEKGTLEKDVKNTIVGQALFLRAYSYFLLVRVYGGVPLLLKPQKIEDNLKVRRASTLKVFESINNDLEKSIALLKNQSFANGDKGRIGEAASLAFKGRVSLYMASPLFNPKNPYTNAYWQNAYATTKKAKEELETKGFALAEKYEDIWSVNNEGNAEALLTVKFTPPTKVNGRGLDFRINRIDEDAPVWGFIEKYPMKDGLPIHTSKYNYEQKTYWKDRDPRFYATIVYNGAVCELEGVRGRRIYTDPKLNTNDRFRYDPIKPVARTGIFSKKGIEIEISDDQIEQTGVDWIEIRFAEVLLNYAEAANETGHVGEALTVLKSIRKRAGIEPGTSSDYGIKATSKEDIREFIYLERHIEFIFEGQRFWDLKRARKLNILADLKEEGVMAILKESVFEADKKSKVFENKLKNYEYKPEDFEYKVGSILNKTVEELTFFKDIGNEKYYFAPIPGTQLRKNPNLEQSKYWGGNFNPTLE
ncbi:TonB-linked outer membrane protein, SusC/RagA family [Elysia marginata]|uniref:TonB-linked outer membrane protein, SusC/RagA family n=1 Tax=Elysia marginata TaxID=1093978 RepID=A0AAV4FWG3_9GAST|nr:TonB-linked outer membrane protein, SusC/RagA family [Elysia marginata]